MTQFANPKYVLRPNLWHFLLESRFLFSFAAYLLCWPFFHRVAYGKGQPVLVLPGLFANDFSTLAMRFFLKVCGFAPHRWRLGRNRGEPEDVQKIISRVEELQQRYGQKVSIIGWSLGGIYARLVANERPELVQQVITLSAPFADLTAPSNARWIYEELMGKSMDDIDPSLLKSCIKTPEVPLTCFYSKTDNMVPWQYCRETYEGPGVENIEVNASHLGIKQHPVVLFCMAERLSQDAQSWQQLRPSYAQYLNALPV